jgi:hypothetical protein
MDFVAADRLGAADRPEMKRVELSVNQAEGFKKMETII